jgi:hypothetical protein
MKNCWEGWLRWEPVLVLSHGFDWRRLPLLFEGPKCICCLKYSLWSPTRLSVLGRGPSIVTQMFSASTHSYREIGQICLIIRYVSTFCILLKPNILTLYASMWGASRRLLIFFGRTYVLALPGLASRKVTLLGVRGGGMYRADWYWLHIQLYIVINTTTQILVWDYIC